MSTETVAAAVRDAIANRTRVRIAGAGTWMSAGRPVVSDTEISLASDKGIVDYVPDDLTITVRAGTTLAEISAATRANGQWLPLDPFGGGQGTIGATIATASSGPLAHSFGFARDFILGLEIVTGKGDVIRTGGRVVKNVAGFDLMRLNCGAWGTLGIITQVSLRLYAIQKVDRTFALPVPGDGNAAIQFLESLRTGPLAALAMEGISSAVASALGLPSRHTVLVRLAGNTMLVDAQLATLGKIGQPTEIPSDVWDRLTATDFSAYDAVIRTSGLPSNIAQTWEAAHALLESSESGFLHSTFSRGSARVGLKGIRPGILFPAQSPSLRVSYEKLPAQMWAVVSPSVTADDLSRSVKRAFDPNELLNPGILG